MWTKTKQTERRGGQPDVKKTGCILDQPSAEYGSGGVVVHMSRIRLDQSLGPQRNLPNQSRRDRSMKFTKMSSPW